MGITDLFSKRQRRLRGEIPDVYVYDAFPNQLKVQVVHVIRDALGVDRYGSSHASQVYEYINNTLCREYGLFELTKHPRSLDESIFKFFLAEESVDKSLDVVELCFWAIDTYVRSHYPHNSGAKIRPDDAISELNARFKEHAVGFQFESSELIRVDSQFIHSEAVIPALAILRNEQYKGANEEFLKAHEHYRHGRYKECLVDSLKAFESTMKTICTNRGWPTQPTDTAKTLINICLSNGLLPTYLESQMGSLRSLLESGLPTVRNKLGGHGQGSDPVAVPDYFARYALNLTASSILLMAEADAEKK
ncbi:MAG: hypothetical protein Q7T38_02450 [Gallionella sp.]|nr:hypothetical protein [Gallionella sp.]